MHTEYKSSQEKKPIVGVGKTLKRGGPPRFQERGRLQQRSFEKYSKRKRAECKARIEDVKPNLPNRHLGKTPKRAARCEKRKKKQGRKRTRRSLRSRKGHSQFGKIVTVELSTETTHSAVRRRENK